MYESLKLMIEDYCKENASVTALAASSRSVHEKVTRGPRHGAFRCLLGLRTGPEETVVTQFGPRGSRQKLISLAENALSEGLSWVCVFRVAALVFAELW